MYCKFVCRSGPKRIKKNMYGIFNRPTSRRITSIGIVFGKLWWGTYHCAMSSSALAFIPIAFTEGTPIANWFLSPGSVNHLVKCGNFLSCILARRLGSCSNKWASTPGAKLGFFHTGSPFDMLPKEIQKGNQMSRSEPKWAFKK